MVPIDMPTPEIAVGAHGRAPLAVESYRQLLSLNEPLLHLAWLEPPHPAPSTSSGQALSSARQPTFLSGLSRAGERDEKTGKGGGLRPPPFPGPYFPLCIEDRHFLSTSNLHSTSHSEPWRRRISSSIVSARKSTYSLVAVEETLRAALRVTRPYARCLHKKCTPAKEAA